MPVSPRRADTRRNHERILAVAAETVSRSGDVSFNAVAKEAGVGVGTVYRHFPTPEALILAVYEREVRHLIEIVPDLLDHHSPEQALRVWIVDHLAHYMMTKRGLANALRTTRSELPTQAYSRMLAALDILRKANAEAGTIRPDLTTETLMRGLGGLFFLSPDGNWKAETEGVVDLVWHGMGMRIEL
ncbi:TetR/AcrR family transcriptional regulator [Amycolatopsis jejuensis]|uniref:TetR/AcrR family transcriptional regulator n=1 Tax=Amycolatopsis jejuensis TaxID=330084 RepID=UPI0005277382|nr:TetR/AcrR family transcriptional regulator [Amycolatopsis jejuensis]